MIRFQRKYVGVSSAFLILGCIVGFIAYRDSVIQRQPDFVMASLQRHDYDNAVTGLRLLIRADGSESALSQLKKRVGSSLVAHLNTHAFGEALYEEFGVRGASLCDEYLEYACLHGMYIRAARDGKILELVQSCTSVSYWSRKVSCFHGIGHGFMAQLDENLAGLQDALQECDHYIHDKTNVRSCTGGVFMEYDQLMRTRDNGVGISLVETKRDPLYPCNRVKASLRAECMKWKPVIWMEIAGGPRNLNESVISSFGSHCLRATTRDEQQMCFQGIGMNIGIWGFNSVIVNKLCKASSKAADDQVTCLIGAIGAITTIRDISQDQTICDVDVQNEETRCQEKLRERSDALRTAA